MGKLKNKPEYLLKNALDFAEEDLESNREGRLSENQIALLRRESINWLSIALTGLVSGMLLFSGNISSNLFWLIVGIFLFIFFGQRYLVNRNVLNSDRVNSIEGRVHQSIVPSFLVGTDYRLTVNDTMFSVSKNVFLAFKNTDPYVMYYITYSVFLANKPTSIHSRKILSAEWLYQQER